MSPISVGPSHPKPCSGWKKLRRCRNNEDSDNVILIDVDSEHSDYVIDIDDLQYSLKKKFCGPNPNRKEKKGLYRNVIYIDDDETPDFNHSNVAVKNSVDASSSRKACSATRNLSDAGDATAKDCRFGQESTTPVKLSKCKRTYSEKASTRNCYGLNADSESDASENDDYSDCELLEDSSGKAQEQWEKAFFRRRKNVSKGDSVGGNSGSASHGIKGKTRQPMKARNYPGARKLNKESEGPFFSMKEDAEIGGSHVFTIDDLIDFSMLSLHKSNLPRDKLHVRSQSDFQPKDFVFIYTEPRQEESLEHPTSANSADQDHPAKEVNETPSYKEEETPIAEPCPPKSGAQVKKDCCNEKISSEEDEPTMCKCQNSFETGVDSDTSVLGGDQMKFQETKTGSDKERNNFKPLQPNETNSAREKENLMPARFIFKQSTLHGKQTNESLHKNDNLKRSHLENRHPDPDIPLSSEEDKDDHPPDGDALASVEICIISEREKHKETDEYKRATEEEWASRQQALQIQAEEAQRQRRLLKRRKAESTRLLDMERRQKQRLEEIRDTQKKVEENMYTKDAIRAEIRNNLNKLELSCHNMASLLHCLGIPVGGWPTPLPPEVQTAYKRALLTFHPDRSSRSDIRQQVEAEEKFKLVNRLKEKFKLP